VEFGDFQCEICGIEEETIEKVQHQYGSRIRFVFRQFPVTELHQYAEKAAEASECAAEQGKFWEAERKFYENQSDLSISSLERYAAELGLDVNRFHECLSTGEMSDRVKRDMEDGRALGVRRTPTLFLGHEQIVGGVDYDKLAELIDQQLSYHKAILVQGNKAELPSAADGKQSSGVAAQSSPPLSGSSSIGTGIGDSGNVFTQYAGAGLGCSADEAKLLQPKVIRTSEAKRLSGKGQKALFVDVREPMAYRTARIPGAINVPVEDVQERYQTLPRDRILVLYESGHSQSSS